VATSASGGEPRVVMPRERVVVSIEHGQHRLTLFDAAMKGTASSEDIEVPLSGDCERVLITAGGGVGTWDGDARFAGVVSTPGN